MKSTTLALTLLLLTSVATAQSVELVLRLYDVSTITEVRFPTYAPRLGHEGSTIRFGTEMDEQEPSRFLSVDALADYIRDSVEPSSWDSGGDVMGMEGGLLLVKNRPAVQEKVQEFLRGMAAGASQRIGFSVELYELDDSRYPTLAPNQVLPVLPVLPGNPEKPEKPDPEVKLVESASGEAWPGIPTVVQVTNRVRYICDYDVEIAQAANISNPIVRFGLEGTTVEMIARPTVEGDRLVIDTIVQHGRFDRPFRQLELGVDEENLQTPYRSKTMKNLGILELPVFRHVGAVSTRIVPAGGSFTIPVVAEGRTLIFRVKTKILGARPPDSILSTDALCHRPKLAFFGDSSEMEEPAEAQLLAPRLQRYSHDQVALFPGTEELMDLIIQNVAPWYWEEGEAAMNISERHDLIVRASDDILKAVRKFVVDLENQQLRQVYFDLRVLSTAAAIEPGVRDSFPEGVPLYAGTVSSLPGRRTSFQAGNTMNYLADYEVEVAQEARISDPIVAQSFEGLVANLEARFTPDGERLVTKLKLRLSIRKVGQTFDSGARFLGPIDRIEEDRHEIATTVTIPTGSVFVVDGGVNPDRPGERLLIAIKASSR